MRRIAQIVVFAAVLQLALVLYLIWRSYGPIGGSLLVLFIMAVCAVCARLAFSSRS